MKIGIVTVQDSNNFGSFLQAYAMQSLLQSMGHEVYFIRTRSRTYIKRIFYHIKPNRHEIKTFPQFVSKNWNGWKKYCRFQKEQQCFRVLEHADDLPLDLIILGSDEIWNVQTAVFQTPIFYGVQMDPVMAYGVSIGSSEISDMRCIPEAWFQHVSPIFARDFHTSEFLHTIGISAPVVCDPTFLVDRSVFYRPYHSQLQEGGPYLLVYSYGLEEKMVQALQLFAKQQGLRLLSACFPFSWCDGTFDCAALDFCAVLEQASYVFTSTFHGTIFSVLMHKQFVSLPQSRKTRDLLERLQLADRLMESSGESMLELSEKFLQEKIDFSTVDMIVSEMKASGLKKLIEGIERGQ